MAATSRFSFGDVVLVPFPLTDPSGIEETPLPPFTLCALGQHRCGGRQTLFVRPHFQAETARARAWRGFARGVDGSSRTTCLTASMTERCCMYASKASFMSVW